MTGQSARVHTAVSRVLMLALVAVVFVPACDKGVQEECGGIGYEGAPVAASARGALIAFLQDATKQSGHPANAGDWSETPKFAPEDGVNYATRSEDGQAVGASILTAVPGPRGWQVVGGCV